MSLLKYKNKKKQNSYDNFCVLLTATIKPFNINAVKRFDPKIRERDYLNSLKLWLTKTKFKIVFCENSGYDLKNIRDLCNKYPNRVEIIQFNLTDYSKGKDYGYGEFKIIEKAMNDSVFIKHSENIIKVTGRVFIKNIIEIVDNCDKNSIINYTKHKVINTNKIQIWTVIFIFQKKFWNFMIKRENLLSYMNFESLFRIVVKDIALNKNKFSVIGSVKYKGYSAFYNINYNFIFNHQTILIIKYKYIKIYTLFLGIIGSFLKSKISFIYNILKPYFPDKK